MHSLKHQLPPLAPLVAFEAAARHGSFTLAAAELHLSQAAISQQIKQLEANLETPLFERSHRSVRLSVAGQEFQHTVTAVLNELAGTAAGMRQNTGSGALTIAVDQSIAAMWLMPRIGSFKQQHRDLNVRLMASDSEADCLSDDVDIAIIHGAGRWPGYDSVLLFPEEIFAVCSPAWLTAKGADKGVNDWAAEDLLELEDARWNWMHWRTWLSRQGVSVPADTTGFTINSYPLLIAAARNGQGVALGWRYLVDDDLNAGTLVEAAPFSVTTGLGYYLVWSGERPLAESCDAFRQWAIDEISGVKKQQEHRG